MDELSQIFEQLGIGAPVELTVLRKGERRQVRLTLVEVE